MPQPEIFDITVVIPAYNRPDLLRASINSVLIASHVDREVRVETLVVDDGSNPSLASVLSDVAAAFPSGAFRIVTQTNNGSAAARINGLSEAKGKYVQFLDSDDLLHPKKLISHVHAMDQAGSELSYSDQATAHPYDPLSHPVEPPVISRQVLPLARTPAELFIRIQTSPHTPVFLTKALQAALNDPLIPHSRIFEPAGDTWLFFNCVTQPWKVTKVDGCYAIYVQHEDERHSTKWEKTGIPGLGLSLCLALRCIELNADPQIRAEIGAAALRGFRRLPRHFHREYERLTLAIYCKSPRLVPNSEFGGKSFRYLAKIFGVSATARFLRYWQRADYTTCQTIPREELNILFRSMIEHVQNVCGRDRFEATFGLVK